LKWKNVGGFGKKIKKKKKCGEKIEYGKEKIELM